MPADAADWRIAAMSTFERFRARRQDSGLPGGNAKRRGNQSAGSSALRRARSR